MSYSTDGITIVDERPFHGGRSLSIRTTHGDKVIQGKISNLSVVGARVDTEAELEDEAELEINLILSVVDEESEPHSDVIAVVATVVWILESDDSGYTSGLRFDIMGPHELERLRRVLRALAAN